MLVLYRAILLLFWVSIFVWKVLFWWCVVGWYSRWEVNIGVIFSFRISYYVENGGGRFGVLLWRLIEMVVLVRNLGEIC